MSVAGALGSATLAGGGRKNAGALADAAIGGRRSYGAESVRRQALKIG